MRRPDDPEPPVPNAVLGVVLLIGAEAMMFAALISAYLIYRIGGGGPWPPPGQPRLPLGVTAANTAVLLGSGLLVWRRRLLPGFLLGLLFLAVQGSEWIRLLGYGLRITRDIYGATFYTLVGLHAAHVLAGLVWLGVSLARRTGGRLSRIYWAFVVLLWPALFALVYLPWKP